MHRDHRKIVVIDGEVAYTGGMNVADYYITGKPEFGEWHDIHCRVEGDVVGDLQKIFINFWNIIFNFFNLFYNFFFFFVNIHN